MLHHRTGDREASLAHLDEEGSHLTTQLARMTMPPVGVGRLSLGPHPLEEPIHSRMMHADITRAPGLLHRGSLLNLLDHLMLGSTTLL